MLNIIKAIVRFLTRKVILPFIYFIYSKKPVQNDLALFADERLNSLPDNMLPVYNALKEKGYHCVTVLAPLRKRMARMKNYLSFTKLYAQAKYVFLVDYYTPIYVNPPRPGAKVIQLWHAAGAFKKWGYSTIDAAWGSTGDDLKKYPIHTNYTHVTVSSQEIIPQYAEAFNMDKNRIFPYGVPRTDVFFDAYYIANGKNKLLEIFPEAAGKKIILYAPTFRGVKASESYNESKLDFQYLQPLLGTEYVFIMKYHPFVANKTVALPEEYASFAMDVTQKMDISEALCAADILLTDYSSVVFEYALLQRPMLFYAYDLEQYIDERGFYYPYTDFVPGPIVKDNKEIADAVLSIKQGFDHIKIKAFEQKFMSACDGHSTERILEKILEIK